MLFLSFNGLAQTSETQVNNGLIVIEQLNHNNYIDRRKNILQTAYEKNQIDSLNSLSDFEDKDYDGCQEMYQELTSRLAKSNFQFIQVNETDYDSLKNNNSDNKHYYIELDLTVKQFKSGGMVLISGFSLYNSMGELLFNGGAKGIIKKIMKQAP